jgi:hypothetical protein
VRSAAIHDRDGPSPGHRPFTAGKPHIEGMPVWEGPIGVAGLGSSCVAGIRDPESGESLWTSSEPFDIAAPETADERLGAVLSFGALPDDVPGGDPFVTCEPWAGRGWTVGRGAEASRGEHPETGADGFHVSASLVWVDELFTQAFSECIFAVEDSGGRTMGAADETLAPPVNAHATNLKLRSFVVVDDNGGADRATIRCRSILPREFERGGSD